MRTGWTLLLCVVASAATSAVTASLVVSRSERPGEPVAPAPSGGESREEGRPATVLTGTAAPRADVASRIEALEEPVSRLERSASNPAARPDAGAPRTPEALLARLAEASGDQTVAIDDAFRALVRLGDAGVPATVEALRSGKDQSYGGGFSAGNGLFKSYPRSRTVLLDALRQIGTPAAKRGLLDAVRSSRSLVDARDLLLMYGSTTDPEVAASISALVPDLLTRIREMGTDRANKEASMVTRLVFQWIARRRLTAAIEPLAALVESEAGTSGREFETSQALDALVGLSPDRAFSSVDTLVRAGRSLGGVLGIGPHSGGGLAPWAAFYELVFRRLTPDTRTRWAIYSQMPTSPSPTIESADERAADAKAMLDLMDAHLVAETDPGARRILSGQRDLLANAIAEEAKRPR